MRTILGRFKTEICDYCMCAESVDNKIVIINDEFICEHCLVAPMTEEEFDALLEEVR